MWILDFIFIFLLEHGLLKFKPIFIMQLCTLKVIPLSVLLGNERKFCH